MEPWFFIYNGVDSREMGVHVISYPPIIRPQERVKFVSIPGRAGDLTQREGEAVYDAYDRSMKISNARGFSLERVTKWLRGRGEMIVGNEPQYKYQVDLSPKCQFDKQIKGFWGGPLQMHTQPFKQAVFPEADITITETGQTVYNPGDVPSAPLITLHGSGDGALTIGGEEIEVFDFSDGWQIDCSLEWVINGLGAPQWNAASGLFGRLPPGNSPVSFSGGITGLVLSPRWLYL